MKNKKRQFRQKVLVQRRKLNNTFVDTNSQRIISSLIENEIYKKSETIFTYLSFENEVDTLNFIKKEIKNKKIVVPYIYNKQIKLSLLPDFDMLHKNSFGIYEPKKPIPVDTNKIDLTIVPGIVFDKNGNRIGFGCGYYDKILSKMRAHKIGLCYDFQIFENIPNEEHDIKMDSIITEKNVY